MLIYSCLYIWFYIIYKIEDEQILLQELRKIEARKRDRDRKTQDLQKLISAVDKQNDSRKSLKIDKKSTPHHRKRIAVPVRPTRVDPNVMFEHILYI